VEHTPFAQLPPEDHEQLRREVLALAWRWRRREGVYPPGAREADRPAADRAGASGDAVDAALSRVLADLDGLAVCISQTPQDRTRPGASARGWPPDGARAAAPARAWAPAGLLPDDPDLYELLHRVERRLLRPWAAATSPPAGAPLAQRLPVLVADGPRLLAAYRRVLDTLPPPGSAQPIWGTNGRWKLIGLHVLSARADTDVACLQAALGEMSAVLAGPPLSRRQETALSTLRDLAGRSATTPEALVGDLARVLSLVDMPADRASLELRSLLSSRPGVLRLDHVQSELYREFTKRVITLILDFDRLLPSLFDGADGGEQ
jgi:hypothetical protein